MQFEFLGDEQPDTHQNTIFSPKILLRCQGKSEIEMFHEFQKYFDMCKIMDGDLFFAKVTNSPRSAPKSSPLCNILSFNVYSMNQKLISNKLPTTWTSEKPKQGFVFKTIQFRPSNFLVKDVGILLKSDISLEKCGPLLDGCRLLDYTGRDFIYLFYNNVTKTFMVEARLPPPLVKMESLKTICLAAAVAPGVTLFDYSILPLDLQSSIQQYHLNPRQQMAFKGCFKTVKIWHSNQKLWQEIEYDAETKKYHGKARVWDFTGNLVLEMYFDQGQMHGKCVTFDSRAAGFPTSMTVFEHNVPTEERIRFQLAKDCKQTTRFQPGSCIHRIRFHTTSVSDDEDEGTDKEEHAWGLLSCDSLDLKWKGTVYDDEKIRDSWDSWSQYVKLYTPFSTMFLEGFVPACLCVKKKVEAAADAASVAVATQKKHNLLVMQNFRKRGIISTNSKKKTFLKIKKIKFN